MRIATMVTAAILAVASAALPAGARAQAPGEVRIYEENDSINPFGEYRDGQYTQGLRLEVISPERSRDRHFLPGISHAAWCRLICGRDAANHGVNAGSAIGQNMYTPAEIRIARPQPNDRPWAGFLYASRIARVSYVEPGLKAQRQDRIELQLGIVGPASLAKETQIWWHSIVDAPRPRGWANQLRNEAVAQLRYDVALRWPREEGGNADIIPRVRASLGNADVSVGADVTGRIGWNLAGFGILPQASTAPEPMMEAIGPSSRLAGGRVLASGNLFVRAGIKAVAHNIFIDGNTFARNDIRIRRTWMVPEIAAGVELNLFGPIWASYQFIHRGSEYETRNGTDGTPQEYSAIMVAWVIRR